MAQKSATFLLFRTVLLAGYPQAMSQPDNVVSLYDPKPLPSYAEAEAKVLQELVQYCLIESLENFQGHQREYPFISPDHLLPARSLHTREWQYQHPAFVVLLDNALPRALNKYFRLRNSNLVSWRNLLKVLPEAELEDFRLADCNVEAPEFNRMLKNLLPLDFALLIQSDDAASATNQPSAKRLSHMHVKVERLTDIALKELGKELNYIKRSLFERGKDYVEALEAKFFEYFGFSAHASGRKSAAAMAAQLLMKYDTPFTVFAASQSDLRLTLLRNHHRIEQYFLISLSDRQVENLLADDRLHDWDDLSVYQVDHLESGERIFIYRAEFERTAAALPASQPPRDQGLQEAWLDYVDGHIVAPTIDRPPLPYDWAAAQIVTSPTG